MDIIDVKPELTDKIKESVIGSGALAHLKNVSADAAERRDHDMHELKQQAQAVIDDISQKLHTGKLDDSTSIKLSSLILKLQSALHKSPSALGAALSEAMAAMGDSGSGAGTTMQQKVEQLWHCVDTDNKDISDDFDKMHAAGVTFNETLWNRHKKLMQDLQTHPHDLKTQKELDAVDDAMLMQAKPQLDQCPSAKTPFEDAQKKSQGRHQLVDKDLAGVNKNTSVTNNVSMGDFDGPASTGQLTMNDVTSQSIGTNAKGTGKSQTV